LIMVIDCEAGKVRAQRAAELPGISKLKFGHLVSSCRQRGIEGQGMGGGEKPETHTVGTDGEKEIDFWGS
jgi:hypothetical protein